MKEFSTNSRVHKVLYKGWVRIDLLIWHYKGDNNSLEFPHNRGQCWAHVPSVSYVVYFYRYSCMLSQKTHTQRYQSCTTMLDLYVSLSWLVYWVKYIKPTPDDDVLCIKKSIPAEVNIGPRPNY